MEVNYDLEGFLKDAVYSAGLREFMLSYDGKFSGLDILNLKIKDSTNRSVDFDNIPSPFTYSQDNKELTISTSKRIYADGKGKFNKLPSQESYYTGLRFLFDRAVEEHKKRNI